MTGIARIVYDNTNYSASIVQSANGYIDMSGGLETIVTLTMFTDGYSSDHSPHRGWWGDSFASNPNYKHGSKIWTLRGKKITQATLNQAKRIVQECLQFLVQDKIAKNVQVSVDRYDTNTLAVQTIITRLDGTQWPQIWEINLNAV